MAEKIPSTYIEQTGKDKSIIDQLVHEIQNDLQVIRMEADLRLVVKREPLRTHQALENIESLLGALLQRFSLP